MAKTTKSARKLFSGKVFAFTGFFILQEHHINREYIKSIIQRLGGKVISWNNNKKVPRSVNVLIAGAPNSLVKNARDCKLTKSLRSTSVEVITANTFYRWLPTKEKSALMKLKSRKAA